MKYIRKFNEIGQGDLSLVGGKGLNLGLMTNAGFDVPPGFCLTSEAFPSSANGQPTPMADDVREALIEAYSEMGQGLVAVRSSAIGEDLPDASFAGQQETFLSIEGADALVDAVIACWNSLWTERAIVYRRDHEMPEEEAIMCVVVQRMIDADSAGVMFTVNPITGTPGEYFVEAVWGLGEPLVSGDVTPDRYSVDKNGRMMIETAFKKTMLTLSGAAEVPEDKREASVLNEDAIKELVDVGARIHEYYGGGQDIEWATENGQFYILQARPVTVVLSGLSKAELRTKEIEKLRELAYDGEVIWSNFSVSEVINAPLPMTYAIFSRIMSGEGGYGAAMRELGYDFAGEAVTQGLVDLIFGRTYLNLKRNAESLFAHVPFDYNFEKIKADPGLASYPEP
ncbi:PEP/pyruvate-binding domain-containing protein, partial [Candidatus Hydrogenedentota bacterium]